jgi:hypothetical protein
MAEPMPESKLPPISAKEHRRRWQRVERIAKDLGFQGTVEYRHVIGRTGGAQYGVGATENDDLLVVFADAFLRDADPQDFSLEGILAHERGHQLVIRHATLRTMVARGLVIASEEIVASLIGSLIAASERDRKDLYRKAVFDAVQGGMESGHAARLLRNLRQILGDLLCLP